MMRHRTGKALMPEIPAADRVVGAADNRPALVTLDQLALDHRDLSARLEALEHAANNQPDAIDDDDEQGELQDCVKDLDAFGKYIEAMRENVKAPYLTASRVVDGFFKQYLTARITLARERLARIGGDYLRRKEAAERSRREAEARRLRDEEQKRRAEAQEQERKAQALRERDKPAIVPEIQANTATNVANAIGSAAWEAEQLARARPADLARTRSTAGSLGTLQTFWDFEIDNLETVDKDKLWPYIARAEKEKAVRAFIRSNAPETTEHDWQPLAPAVRMVRATRPQFR